MNFLKQWIILNPKYKHLNVDPNIIPDNQTNEYTYQIQDIKMMNERLIGVFESALAQQQNDPELYVRRLLSRMPLLSYTSSRDSMIDLLISSREP